MLPEQNKTPFTNEQYQLIQQLLGSATPDQKAWLAGYITAQTSAGGQVAPTAAAGDAEITILVGSQTGNCDEVSERAAQVAASKGLNVAIKKMGQYKLPQLKKEKFLLVLISTQGEGDPPDNALDLYEFLYSKKAPKLKETEFAVLGLGDSSYEFFCKMGKDFDQRLEELGGKRLHDRIDCDLDYEEATDEWLESVFTVLATKVEKSDGVVAAAPAFAAAPASQYSKKNPFPSTVLEDIVLNGRGTDKETHHIELSLEDSGLTYEPGDSIGVLPTNDPEVVDDLIKALNFKPDDSVTYSKEEHSLGEALLHRYEATIITRPVIQKYAEYAKNSKLDALLAEDNKAGLNDYLYGRELVDMVTDFPAKDISPQAFTDCLRKLPPRLYSIASSLKAHPDEVHLTVAAVRYNSHGRDRKGVCSTYLADRIADDATVPVYVDENSHFKLPADPSTPIIMIGPGTGVAPFRAFVEEREEIGATGKNWLFFGDQHFTTDFLYQAEWLRFLKDGILTQLDVAFSRDQEHKIYVQHRIKEKSKDVYAWLQEGASVYVCGDEKHMAHDVHDALLDVIARESGGDKESAEEYMKALQKDKRYQRDVY